MAQNELEKTEAWEGETYFTRDAEAEKQLNEDGDGVVVESYPSATVAGENHGQLINAELAESELVEEEGESEEEVEAEEEEKPAKTKKVAVSTDETPAE